jgi:tRNA uridine 5-carboxymethylaminomethyl modification enzyme
MKDHYDIVVIGGGHAGAEAAYAAARGGAETALVTMKRDAIGRMSCNPAIGGLGKGQMVREIDALGGLMGLAIDATGIQFRMLNRGKGPAVWAPRAQADRALYAAEVRRRLEAAPNLVIVEALVDDLITRPRARHLRRSTGVRLHDGRTLHCNAVVLTTGTFLRGLLHCGEDQAPGGRVGEPAATGMSACLQRLGLRLGRLKTGTPPRVHRDSIDYDKVEPQPGDDPPTPFSFVTDRIDRSQLPCWITWTNPRTHDLIRANLHRAPMYSGQIKSRGPRYCPSIEDKVVRFADKERHQVFLEPEGRDSDRIYCNGIPTSLPKDVQEPLVRSIAGLEDAQILQHGYAVEYDWVPTDQTNATLETKRVAGLFLAGQINGTSGYEEAAGQGLVAGINAVRTLAGADPLVLGRDEAYVGVMIDDLVTRPPDEPYRMFTSRAEYRLQLRTDNADERLTPIGRQIGLVDDERWARFERKREHIAALESWLAGTRVNGASLREQLRRPEVRIHDLLAAHGNGLADLMPDAIEQVQIRVKYQGYIDRQARQIARFRQIESLRIPDAFDYEAIGSLRTEAKEKLIATGPRTLGQAGRISGISPADLSVLYLHLHRL